MHDHSCKSTDLNRWKVYAFFRISEDGRDRGRGRGRDGDDDDGGDGREPAPKRKIQPQNDLLRYSLEWLPETERVGRKV